MNQLDLSCSPSSFRVYFADEESKKGSPVHFTFPPLSDPVNDRRPMPESLCLLNKMIRFHTKFLKFYSVKEDDKLLVDRDGDPLNNMNSEELFKLISQIVRKKVQNPEGLTIEKPDKTYYCFFKGEELEIILPQEIIEEGEEATRFKGIALHHGAKISIKVSKTKEIYQQAISFEYTILSDLNTHGPVLGIMEKPVACYKLHDKQIFWGRHYEDNYLGLICQKIKGGIYISFEKFLFDFSQVFHGLKMLADHEIFHGNVKLENLYIHRLASGVRIVALGNFIGSFSSRHDEKKMFAAKEVNCTPEYTPEDELQLLQKHHQEQNQKSFYEVAKKIDAFAFGCVLYEVLAHCHPFALKPSGHPLFGPLDFKSTAWKAEFVQELICDLLMEDPIKRVTIAEAYERWNQFIFTNHPQINYKISRLVKRHFAPPQTFQGSYTLNFYRKLRERNLSI
jgi:serine/threonine protein kinase